MYGIYCIRDDHPRPVLSADASLYEVAQKIEQDIAERIRMAKALGIWNLGQRIIYVSSFYIGVWN